MLYLFLIPCLFVICALMSLWWYQNDSRHFKKIHKIPGPPGLPIFGQFMDYLTTMEKIFEKDRERCTKYFPIYKIWVLHATSVCLMDPNDIEIVLSSTKHIKKSQIYDILHLWLGTGLLTSTGEKWRARRKMLTPAFHFNILQGFVDIFNEATMSLVRDFDQRLHEPHINVVPPITEFTLQSMAESSMGMTLDFKTAASRNYKRAMFDFIETAIYRVSKPWWYDDKLFRFSSKSFQAFESVHNLHEFTRNIIKERKKTLQGSSYTERKRLAMLDLLLKAQDEGVNIDDDGIREEVDTFMFEGHDTTAVAICHVLLLLANHKRVQDEIRQEIIDVVGDSDRVPSYGDLQELSYTDRCLKECLRLYPSVPLIGRDVDEDIETATGYTIPKGSMVHIFIYDLHRHPEIYPDPLKFDPDRFLPENSQKRHPFAYIPFSAGPRNCIGQRFALLELKAVLCGILKSFVLEPIDKPEDLVFNADLVLRSKNPIRIKFSKRIK